MIGRKCKGVLRNRTNSSTAYVLEKDQECGSKDLLNPTRNIKGRLRNCVSNLIDFPACDVLDPGRLADLKLDKSLRRSFLIKPLRSSKSLSHDDIVLRCNEYANDMFQYMILLERKYSVKDGFLQNSEITPKMRSVLVDWIIQVHLRFEFAAETLYQTVFIIDSYLNCAKVSKAQLQLVGIAALFIAVKYEEIVSPEIMDYVYISDNSFSKREILKMEFAIFSKIGFFLGRPHSIQFLRRISTSLIVINSSIHGLAKFICELALFDYSLCCTVPSQTAFIAAWISLMLHSNSTSELESLAGLTNEECRKFACPFVASILKYLEGTKLVGLKKKYGSARNYNIAKLSCEQLNQLKSIMEE